MKAGRTLQSLAAELERQVATRKDYVAAQGAIGAVLGPGDAVMLAGLNGAEYGIAPHAHGQFADHLGIPKRYYDRMRTEQPGLLAANLNGWLHADGGQQRMVRTLDGQVRAFLSPKYRPLDNFDLASVVIPEMQALGVEVLSSELTETRMYIKGILPALSDTLPEGMAWGGHDRVGGDRGAVCAAVTVCNSDVGASTLRIEPSVFTSRCTNMAILFQAAMRKYHIGKASSADEGFEIFRDDTRQADDRAFWLKVRDVLKAAFNREVFADAVTQMRNAAQAAIHSTDLPKVVDITVRQLALPESAAGGILTFLARGGDLTRWGLSSAITRMANDHPDYEGATDLERAGGKVLALTGNDWEAISTAA